jgi:integral membrane protein (TIGR01906 family)
MFILPFYYNFKLMIGDTMKKFKFTDILIGVVFTLLFISIGVIAAVNFRFVYYHDISSLNIVEISGLDRQTITENYDALIDYNSPFFKGDLKFPSLAASASGLQHFAEVKNLFVAFYYIGFIALLLSVIIIVYKLKQKENHYLLISSITVLILPAIVVAACAVNFDKTFIIFHKIFFRNNYWLFDPTTDPVINILPDTFFLHCLLVIIAFVVLGSLGLYVTYRIVKSKSLRRRRSITHM